jgi:hypothetical protein
MAFNLPIGKPLVELAADPDDSAQSVTEATRAWQAGELDALTYEDQIKALAAQYPTCLNAWAALGELSLPDDVIMAYAYFRTGYHRGLDRGRASGWNGSQQLPWNREGNQGFLRCLYGLMCAATEIGETNEATRTRQFLLELDTTDHFEVASA